LQAREIARSYGILWTTSGSRPGEIHSAYCHIWRDVLNLTPEGLATACFKLSEAASVRRRGLAIGGWDNQAGIFLLDDEQIQYLRQTLGKEKESCTTCFNHYHCARNCPDACLLESNSQASEFRCRFQSLIANALIQEIAEKLTENQNLNRILLGVVPGPGL
jgi:radical SAM protein with 4Fe4S-binding SPASM domain